jgi:SAM-dependent methyltransferase
MTSNIDPADTRKPLPPDELQYRVSGVRDGEATFRESGRISAVEIEAALASWERPLDSFARILDFGCGCGRIVMWLEGLAAQTELCGTDIDADALEWASANFPYARFERNGRYPPLPFPDAHFDLVFSSSVFTHIDQHAQGPLARRAPAGHPTRRIPAPQRPRRARVPPRRGRGARPGSGHDGLGSEARDGRHPVRRGRQLGRRAVPGLVPHDLSRAVVRVLALGTGPLGPCLHSQAQPRLSGLRPARGARR